MSSLLTDKMKTCRHDPDEMWPDGTCPSCGWNMWETYFENQEELDSYNYNKQLLNLDQKELVKRYVDLKRQLAEARELIKDAVTQLGYYSACGGTQATEFLGRNKDLIGQLKEKGK